MKLIAHRGNTCGARPERENSPKYIMEALEQGYEVEIDLRYDHYKDFLTLGHDRPIYRIDPNFLTLEGLWIHCKSQSAFKYMLLKYPLGSDVVGPNYFWHENDKFTLTSHGYVWPFVNECVENCILNQTTNPLDTYLERYVGICSDNVSYYKGLLGL